MLEEKVTVSDSLSPRSADRWALLEHRRELEGKVRSRQNGGAYGKEQDAALASRA